MDVNINQRITDVEARVTKLETINAKFDAKFERKHDEIALLMNTIEAERKEISEMKESLQRVITLLEENNKDTLKNSQDIEKLGTDVLAMKSTIATLKWVIGGIGTAAGIAVTIIGLFLH